MNNDVAMVRDVVLIGGGHSHVLFMRKWAMQPLPGVRLTLISQQVLTPYSGMLPGLVAGHYSYDEVHIDLARLCQWANVRFIEATACGIDLAGRSVQLSADRPPVGFDVLSLDTGSTPALNISGADVHSVPVKPVWSFYERWLGIREKFTQSLPEGAHGFDEGLDKVLEKHEAQARASQLGVVGSGAGGFELLMAMQYALRDTDTAIHWFVRGDRALKGRPEKVSDIAIEAARRAGVQVHLSFDVVEVQADAVLSADHRRVELDDILWCTAAIAPEWPAAAGLDVDSRGFVQTNQFLQSVSHDCVFATGDIGSQVPTASDKAGVFAVRQAPFLFQNIRRYLLNKPLKAFVPQKDFLSLMATGGKAAIASRSGLAVGGAWVWHWKNHIDQKFMQQFRDLPAMKPPPQAFKLPIALQEQLASEELHLNGDLMHCKGCGAKVGATVLHSVLAQLQAVTSDDVVSGVAQAADTAIVETRGDVLIQSVDVLSAVCSDPFVFGRIAALHALSDVVTEQAAAYSAQAIVSLPHASEALVERDLSALMAGALSALNEADCTLLGGHTALGSELQMGFVVNAFAEQSSLRTSSVVTDSNAAEIPSQSALILTQPLGVGVLLAGFMQHKAKGVDVFNALEHMQHSNGPAARILFEHDAQGLTDITGFGLLGHLTPMLKKEGIGAIVQSEKIALLRGATELAAAKVASTLLRQNQHALAAWDIDATLNNDYKNLLCDPQTGGGLLAIVPQLQAEAAVKALYDEGYSGASCIGHTTVSDKLVLQ